MTGERKKSKNDQRQRRAEQPLAGLGRGLATRVERPRVVAITGAASFLGKNLIGLLEEDPRIARIVAFDTEAPPTAGEKTRFYATDLSHWGAEESLAEVLGAEAVEDLVHLGFLPSPTHDLAWSHELESVGTMHVVNACRRNRVHKLVIWSQTILYGAQPTNPNFLTEKHALRARRSEPYFMDKLDAEQEGLRFGRPGQGRTVTILRMAPILGPSIKNYLTRYLSHRLVPSVLGFDPLWQFTHEADAVAALRVAVLRDTPGVFNIAGDGVLPLSTVIKLAGRSSLPLPRSMAKTLIGTLWAAKLAEAPPSFLDYLQYVCVADTAKAQRVMGFSPVYTTREALIDYTSAQHLREVRLLTETPA